VGESNLPSLIQGLIFQTPKPKTPRARGEKSIEEAPNLADEYLEKKLGGRLALHRLG